MSDKHDRVKAYTDGGFNCAQIVFGVFAENYDIETETALRIAGGFGGGMRCGELCGALTGGVMVIGAARGQYIENDLGAKENCNAATIAFTQEFRKRNGCILCRDLLEADLSTPEGQAKYFEENLARTRCDNFIGSAIDILEELGY